MIYFFLAEGFEEIEALCPIDIMRRAGLEVKTVGVGAKEITGSHGITVVADMIDTEYNDKAPELVFLPGGMPGTLNLEQSPLVQTAIKHAVKHQLPIGAICAAPSILGHLGLLQGKKATCYPGFESELTGATLCDGVVTDGNITTASGAGVAVDFALELVSRLVSAEKAEEIRRGMQCR